MNALSYEKFTDRIIEHKNLYYRIAYSFMGNDADALDAVSQMTLTVIEKHGQLRDEDSFLPWSKKILVNTCRNKLRDKKRSGFLQDFEIPSADFNEDEIAEQLMVRKAVGELPDKHREIVILRFYLDMEYQDISDALDIPLGTVKSRINRAVAALREQLGGNFNE